MRIDLEGMFDVMRHATLVTTLGELFAGKTGVRLIVGLEKTEHVSGMPCKALAAARDACDAFVLVGMTTALRELLDLFKDSVGTFDSAATEAEAVALIARRAASKEKRSQGDGGDVRARFVAALLERDPGDPVAAAYAESLASTSTDAGAAAAARGLVQCLSDEEADEDEIVESLVEIGAPAVPALLEGLDDGAAGLAASAALVRIGEPAIRSLLRHLLRDSAGPALDALVEIGEPVGRHLADLVREAPAGQLTELPSELVDALEPRLDVLEALVARLVAEPELGESLLDEVVVSLATRLGARALPPLRRLVRGGPLDKDDLEAMIAKLEGRAGG